MNILKSRTIWTLVVIAVVGAIQALQPFMQPEIYVFVNGVLLALAGYYKLSPRQTY